MKTKKQNQIEWQEFIDAVKAPPPPNKPERSKHFTYEPMIPGERAQ